MAGNEKRMCELHPDTPAAGACNFCGKPLCRACIRSNGLFCNPQCKAQSAARAAARAQTEAGKPPERDQEFETSKSHLKLFLALIALAGVAMAGYLTWKHLLDPTGKVAWRWECKAPAGALQLVAVDATRTVVRTPQGIVILDTQSGQKLKEFSVKTDPAPPPADAVTENADRAFQPQVRLLASQSLLFINPHSAACYTLDGALKWDLAFPGLNVKLSATSTDDSVLALAHTDQPPTAPEPLKKDQKTLTAEETAAATAAQKEYQLKLAALRESIAVYDIATGKQRWNLRLDKDQAVSGLLASKDQVIATWPVQPAGARVHGLLQAWAAENGSPVWTASAEAFIQSGPQWAGSSVLFKAKDIFHALDAKGQEVFSIPVAKNAVARSESNLLLITSASDCLHAHDLATGTYRWTVKMDSAYLAHLTVTDTMVYARGSPCDCQPRIKAPAEGTVAFNPSPITDDEGVTRNLTIPYLVAIDMATGKVQWSSRTEHWDTFADAERIASLVDTGVTASTDIIAGNQGEMLFKQFNPRNGKIQCERRDRIGLTTPHYAAKRIVGIIYDRSQLPEPQSVARRKPYDPPSCLGVGALTVR